MGIDAHMKSKVYYRSPIGSLEIVGSDSGLTEVNFVEEMGVDDPMAHAPVRMAAAQLDEYFNHRRKSFCLKLCPQGTTFQIMVWKELLSIPYGEVASYHMIARAIGKASACRAVGGANGKNPLPIIVPCHRVIGQDGMLTGYSSGLWRKTWLLGHEDLQIENQRVVGCHKLIKAI